MKKILKTYMAVALLIAGAFTATAQTKSVSVTNNNLIRKGNTVYIDAIIEVDADYVKSKKSLTLTPIIESSNQKTGLPSVLLNGKNRQKVYQREIDLGNLDDIPRYAVINAHEAPTHTISYKTTIPWEDWMKNANLVVTEDLCGCGKEDATQQGPWPIKELYEPTPIFAYVKPDAELRKERAEEGSAFVEFVVGRHEIRPTFRNNAAELDKIDQSIQLVANDDNIVVDNIFLKGFASPEAPYSVNTSLAENRVKSLRSYLIDKYKGKLEADIFTTDFEPEDWVGFKVGVEADPNVPNRDAVMAIINSNDEPDTKENKLRALDGGSSFRYVLNAIFPSLRRTDYKINYTVRGFNLEEAREVIKKNPKYLSLEEMYAVANSYEKGSREYYEVFETAVNTYDSDPIANLNAANIAMNKGDMAAAKSYLDKSGNSPKAAHARGIYALLNGNYTEAESQLKQAKDAGIQEAGKNLEEVQKKVEEERFFNSFK